MTLFLRLCTVILIGSFWPGDANAQTAAEAAKDWGLLGSWMTDCNLQPSEGSRNSYVVRGAQLFLDRDFGPQNGGLVSDAITDAKVQPDGTIDLTVYFASVTPPQTRRNSMVRGSDGRIRMWTNLNLNTGEYSVRDGVLTHNGKPTPSLVRCA